MVGTRSGLGAGLRRLGDSIGAEEALLAGDPVYGDYARRVRWSLVPGVW